MIPVEDHQGGTLFIVLVTLRRLDSASFDADLQGRPQPARVRIIRSYQQGAAALQEARQPTQVVFDLRQTVESAEQDEDALLRIEAGKLANVADRLKLVLVQNV